MAEYDIVVIGAGAAGLVSSKLSVGLGKKTALIEKHKIGGDCTLYGCIPSKALIMSAHTVHQMKRLKEFGVDPKGEFQFDAKKVMAHVRSIVKSVASGHTPEIIEEAGINVLFGSPKFVDSETIEIDGNKITAKKFILCTGSRPMIPPISGLEKVDYLTNETIFNIETLPRSMAILGSGPIGIEIAQALNRLGVKVTVIHRSSQILKKEDTELTERLRKVLEGEGVVILSNTKTLRVENNDKRIALSIENDNGTGKVQAESLLVATGRVFNIEDIGLENAGVQYDTTGVIVDKHLRTTTKNIYACGDIVPPYLFSHISEYEAVIAVTNACIGLPIRKTNYKNIVWTTFSEPELAHCGMTEQQARQQYGNDLKIYRWEHSKVDRCKTDRVENGLSKIICDSKCRILGVQILGHSASELMHEAQLAKSLGTKFSKIASVIHSYPSYSDSIRQPAKRCYIDCLKNNIFIKLVQNIIHNRKFKIAIGAALLILVLLWILPVKDWLVGILQWTETFGPLAPILVILFYIVACVFLLPGWILTVGSGFLFKVFWGTVVVSIGSTLGACAAFLAGRTFGRNWISKKVENNKMFHAIDEAVGKEGFKIALLTRLSPIFPFNLLNYAFGLTKVKFSHYALASWIGMLPVTILYVYFGAALNDLTEAKEEVETGWAGTIFFYLGLVIAVIVTTYITRISKKALRRSIPKNTSDKSQD